MATHSIPSEKDALLTSDEGYALVSDAVVRICDAQYDRLCAVSVSQTSLAGEMIYLVLPSVGYERRGLLLKIVEGPVLSVCPGHQCGAGLNWPRWDFYQGSHDLEARMLASSKRLSQLL